MYIYGVFMSQSDDGTSMPTGGHGSAAPGSASRDGGTNVNRCIFQLAQKYCGDCKNTFDELSKIVQVCRFSGSHD